MYLQLSCEFLLSLYCEKRLHLEPIQEEPEQEDEAVRSRAGEREAGDFQTPADAETEKLMADNMSEEDELRVLRPRRVTRSHTFPQMQFPTNQQEGEERHASLDWNLTDESTPTKEVRVRNDKRSTSGELRIKVGPALLGTIYLQTLQHLPKKKRSSFVLRSPRSNGKSSPCLNHRRQGEQAGKNAGEDVA